MPDTPIRALYLLELDVNDLGLMSAVDNIYITNTYVDRSDTHTNVAPFEYLATIAPTSNTTLVSLPPTMLGSVYHIQLTGAGQTLVSAYFVMPSQDTKLSYLRAHTVYPPQAGEPPLWEGATTNGLPAVLAWGNIIGTVSNQTDLAQEIARVIALNPGPRGFKGEKGDKGVMGDTGPQGAEGNQGAKGVQGDRGPIGETGLTGPKGDTGSIGPLGLQGDPGIQGIKGDTGEQGPSESAASIKTKYEQNPDTNNFSDADKAKLNSLTIATSTQSFLTALRGA